MSSLGAGLLGFASGALGGAEQYIQEEREFKRKFTLEDYRIEKERELASFKEALARETSALDYARDVGENIRKENVVTAEEKARLESEERRAAMAAEARGDSTPRRETEAALDRTFQLGATAINSVFGEQLVDEHPDYKQPKTPEEYILVLEKIGTPEALSAAEYLYEYLNNVDSWSADDRRQWASDLRNALKGNQPAGTNNDPLGIR